MSSFLKYKVLFLLILSFWGTGIGFSQNITIENAKFNFPNPAFPFYHLVLEIDLPSNSFVDASVFIDGRKLRYTELMAKSEYENVDFDHPSIMHRPPSAYALSENNQKYERIVLIGWYRWESGKEYSLEIEMRIKNHVEKSDQDQFLKASMTLRPPANKDTFDRAWKNYKSVVISENIGIDRINEPVEVLLPFYLDESQNIKDDIRVMSFDRETQMLIEIPAQLFDVMTYSEEDDPKNHRDGGLEEKVPYWHPTRTARLCFLADVAAHTSQIYLIFYNNPEADRKGKEMNLSITGNDSVGTIVTNEYFTATLDPKSGALKEISLITNPEIPLYHGLETNGAIQWNPDIYSPPTPWDHTSDWTSPYQKSFSGPVKFELNTWGRMKEYWGVEASTTYNFYSSVPYFIFSSSMRMEETIQTLALRNGEMVFDKELLDHVSWYDSFRDSVMTYDLHALPNLTELRMADDLPWITFYNKESGIAFAGIQLGYDNSGIENIPRLLNPFFYVTIGPWVYWARALSVSYISANHQQVIPAMKGNIFSEKWALLIYNTHDHDAKSPYAIVQDWQKKLAHPLKIRLVEEVDDRASEAIDEIMSGGKSPWEK